jgi:hypothetical protein
VIKARKTRGQQGQMKYAIQSPQQRPGWRSRYMTTLWAGVLFPAGRDSLLTHSYLLWAHLASSLMGRGFFPRRKAAGGVNWATHLNLVSRPSVSETTLLLTLHAFGQV